MSEEIEWDDDVDSEHIGKVTEEVVDEGDVTVSVWAEQKTAEDEKARLKAEAEQQDITTFKHGGGEEDDSQSDENGEGPSNSKLHAGTDTDVFNGPHSNIPKKGMKSDAGKEKTRVKKTPKEEALKKEAAKTGGTRGVAVVKK